MLGFFFFFAVPILPLVVGLVIWYMVHERNKQEEADRRRRRKWQSLHDEHQMTPEEIAKLPMARPAPKRN